MEIRQALTLYAAVGQKLQRGEGRQSFELFIKLSFFTLRATRRSSGEREASVPSALLLCAGSGVPLSVPPLDTLRPHCRHCRLGITLCLECLSAVCVDCKQ